MASQVQSFRLTDGDRQRLARLEQKTGAASKTDVVRYGLLALQVLVDQGFEFREMMGGTRIFQRDANGRIVFFDVGPDGSLVETGSVEWTGES